MHEAPGPACCSKVGASLHSRRRLAHWAALGGKPSRGGHAQSSVSREDNRAGCAKPDTRQFTHQSIDIHLTVRGGSCRGSTMPNIIKAELAIDRASHSG